MINIKYIFNKLSLLSVCNFVYGGGVVAKHNMLTCIHYVCKYVFTVPNPFVQITFDKTLENVTIGDPLTLDCTVTAVRGISSSVDIIWTTGGRVVRRVDNITAYRKNDSTIYTDSFEISSLSSIDNGREFQCTVVINASQPVNSSDQVTLIFPGECVHDYVYVLIYIVAIV